MPFPMMLAAAGIGAGGNIISGLLGNSAQQQANEQNYQIALMNYYAQEQARRESQYEASRQDRESKLGTTDAQGNRTYFKPGVGWVSELSGEQSELSDLYREEELAGMQDLKAKRGQMYKNLARQGREENTAGGLMEAMMRNYRGDPSQAVGRRNRMTAEAANEGMDTAMSAAMVDALRTGTGGQAKIASQFGREKYDALRKAFLENAEGAQEAEDTRFIGEQGNLANLYNAFATRASAMPDAAYNPRNLEGATAAQLGQAMTGGANSSNRLQAAMSQKPADFNYTAEPNFGLANTIQQAGAGIAAGMNVYDSTRGAGPQSYGGYARTGYFPTAPSGGSNIANSMYKQNTGLW